MPMPRPSKRRSRSAKRKSRPTRRYRSAGRPRPTIIFEDKTAFVDISYFQPPDDQRKGMNAEREEKYRIDKWRELESVFEDAIGEHQPGLTGEMVNGNGFVDGDTKVVYQFSEQLNEKLVGAITEKFPTSVDRGPGRRTSREDQERVVG